MVDKTKMRSALLVLALLVELILHLVHELLGVFQRRQRLDLRRVVGVGRFLGAQADNRTLHLPRGAREVGGGLGTVRDLLDRLRPEIDRARRLYEERVPPSVGARSVYFHQELVQTLADGDAALLGKLV